MLKGVEDGAEEEGCAGWKKCEGDASAVGSIALEAGSAQADTRRTMGKDRQSSRIEIRRELMGQPFLRMASRWDAGWHFPEAG